MIELREILNRAKAEGASDIHLAVGIPPKMRIAGKLVNMNYPKLLPTDTLEVILTVMNEQQRDSFDALGEFDLTFATPELGRYRVSAYKQRGTVSLAFRPVPDKFPDVESLGIPDEVMDLAQLERGLVIIAGVGGSGRTTTQALMVDRINQTREVHVITLEDPIEFVHHHQTAMVSQREIGIDSHNVSNAIKAAMREDPDVIMVGDLSSKEVATGVLSAAGAGCMVITSMYAAGTVDALENIIGLYPPAEQGRARARLAEVLVAVVYQKRSKTSESKDRNVCYEILTSNHEIRKCIRAGKFQDILELEA